jgi:hypothetical protein
MASRAGLILALAAAAVGTAGLVVGLKREAIVPELPAQSMPAPVVRHGVPAQLPVPALIPTLTPFAEVPSTTLVVAQAIEGDRTPQRSFERYPRHSGR